MDREREKAGIRHDAVIAGGYRMLEHGAVSLAEELENYVYRACEFITGVFQGYQVNDLLAMHEVDFFRVLARATARVKEQARHMKKAP